MNIPNALTWMRVALIPVLVVLFYLPFRWAHIAAAIAFALAALTDWLDGFLARQLHQTSRFGAFLDPVADKLMVAVVLVLLAIGMPLGLASGVLAVLVLTGLYMLLESYLPPLPPYLPYLLAGTVLGIGLLLGWLGSYFSVRRFIRNVALH